jgi:DNA-binding NarL/FixJ family response regulator
MKTLPPPSTLARPARVVHVDDDTVFLQCVKHTLERQQEITVIGQYTSARQFLQSVTTLPAFDVLIIDYIMPEMNGSELIKELALLKLKLPIISFTSHTFPEYANQLLKDGILHCLPKDQLKQLEALVLKCANQELQSMKRRKTSDTLTPDEVELLLLCCNDYSQKQMSERLFIGPDAVKVRKRLLAQKIGIKPTNINFLKWAIKNGYF